MKEKEIKNQLRNLKEAFELLMFAWKEISEDLGVAMACMDYDAFSVYVKSSVQKFNDAYAFVEKHLDEDDYDCEALYKMSLVFNDVYESAKNKFDALVSIDSFYSKDSDYYNLKLRKEEFGAAYDLLQREFY